MSADESDGEISRTVRICNKLGMHARAAVKFVQRAGQYEAEVFVTKDDQRVNGKSIMGLLTLVAAYGMDITVSAAGPDAEEAVRGLCALVETGFDEGVDP